MSNCDYLPAPRKKAQDYPGNGASLGWIPDPGIRSVEVYQLGRAVEILIAPATVADEGPVDGFVLSLEEVWNPLSNKSKTSGSRLQPWLR